ncbi:hypothetical protein [Rahnella sp. AA]|nr:hypothetical protein [Rahnella sp. AA]
MQDIEDSFEQLRPLAVGSEVFATVICFAVLVLTDVSTASRYSSTFSA